MELNDKDACGARLGHPSILYYIVKGFYIS